MPAAANTARPGSTSTGCGPAWATANAAAWAGVPVPTKATRPAAAANSGSRPATQLRRAFAAEQSTEVPQEHDHQRPRAHHGAQGRRAAPGIAQGGIEHGLHGWVHGRAFDGNAPCDALCIHGRRCSEVLVMRSLPPPHSAPCSWRPRLPPRNGCSAPTTRHPAPPSPRPCATRSPPRPTCRRPSPSPRSPGPGCPRRRARTAACSAPCRPPTPHRPQTTSCGNCAASSATSSRSSSSAR